MGNEEEKRRKHELDLQNAQNVTDIKIEEIKKQAEKDNIIQRGKEDQALQ